MSYTRIGIHKYKKGTTEAGMRRARDGLLPIYRRMPGFLDYEVNDVGDGTVVSISHWEQKDQAEAAVQQALSWIRVELANSFLSAQDMTGIQGFSGRREDGAQNIAVVEAFVDAINRKDLKRLAELIAPGAKTRFLGDRVEEPLLASIENQLRAFPDARVDNLRCFASGNTVVAEYVARGTHEGPLETPGGTLAPTHRAIDVPDCNVYEIANGKISTSRDYFDRASFFRQLGQEAFAAAAAKAGRGPSTEAPARH